MINQFDPHYGVYLEKVFTLAKTLVIKSEIVADLMNQKDQARGHSVNLHEPTTWRYYMNVCGQYHPLDEKDLGGKIKIISMDTLEEIEFTTVNLRKHTTTRKEYQYGTRKYEELIANYPQYETLILGILYPADMNTAVAAKDGAILSYPPDLVEFNEYSFIADLQKWIDTYKLRWTNSQYQNSDAYYFMANLGVMYLNLVPAIITIRKRKCKTNEAHSYHVRQYLASHGFLDDYLDVLTTRQALRFYMNINYLERNIGKMDNFRWLIREVMTERRLPLAEYNMYHDTRNQIEEIYAKPVFKKRSLNNLEFITKEDDIDTFQLLDKEEPLASYNHQYRADNEFNILRKLQNSLSNQLRTKVLESRITDYSDAQVYRLSDTLLNLWLDWSDKGIYRAVVNFNNFKTGERISLYPKDAFYVFWYCYWRWMGVKLQYLPELLAERVPIYPIPNKDWLFKVVPIDGSLGLKEKYAVEDEFADEIISLMPSLPSEIISHEEFFKIASDVNTAANLQYNLSTLEEEAHRRAYKDAMTHRLYADRIIKPTSKVIAYNADKPLAYDDYLRSLALTLPRMTKEDWKNAAFAILDEATGKDLQNQMSIRGLHAAMVRLMIQLSSYSVQYIKDVNEANILISGHASLRLTQPKEYGESFHVVPHGLRIERMQEEGHSSLGDLLDEDNFTAPYFQHYGESGWTLDPTVDAYYESVPTSYYHVPIGIDAYYEAPDLGSNPRGDIPIPGMDKLIGQPLHQQRQLKDVWGHDFYYKGKCNDDDRDDWYMRGDLDGFYYQYPRNWGQNDLDGFYYQKERKLKIEDDLDGFYYQTKEDLHLSGDLEGFYYQKPKELHLKNHLDGFYYHKDKPFLSISELDGFYYNKPKDFKIKNELEGFYYHLGRRFTLESQLEGFYYHDKHDFTLKGDLEGFYYHRDLPPLILKGSLDGFYYHTKPQWHLDGRLDGFYYSKGKVFTINGQLDGFNYSYPNKDLPLILSGHLDGFSYQHRQETPLVLNHPLPGFNMYRNRDLPLVLKGTLEGFDMNRSHRGFAIVKPLEGFTPRYR